MATKKTVKRKNSTKPAAKPTKTNSVKDNRAVKWLAAQRDIYPVIVFAIIPTLFFWTQHNIQELTPLLMRRTLLVAILVGLIYYFIWYLIYKRDKYKASIMAIITIVVTLTYGQLFTVYQKIIDRLLHFVFRVDVRVESYLFFSLLLLVFYVGTAYLVKTRLKYSNNVRNYLAIFASVLLVLNLYPLIKHWTTNNSLLATPFGQEVKVVKQTGKKPDIFYLMIEDYGNDQSLKESYGYDNSAFTKFLEQNNFYVAKKSVANYPFTTPSLVSSLNLDYIPSAFNNKPDNGTYYTLLKDKIESNRVQQFLQGQGYQFINLGSWWTATKYNKNADQDLYDRTGLKLFNKTIDLKEHELILFQDTIAWPLFKRRINMGGKELFGLTFPAGETSARTIQRQAFFHQLETMKQISKEPGPKYVFIHFLIPHGPYVFDEKCNPVKGSQPDENKAFLRQLQCVNLKLKDSISYILKNNKTDPIFVLQTDEGPYPDEFREDRGLDWTKAPDKLLRLKANVLNAFHFPDKNYSKLYQSISPVNNFRVIFDQYYGTDLKLLTDKHYFQESEKKRFFLNDLTDRFKE